MRGVSLGFLGIGAHVNATRERTEMADSKNWQEELNAKRRKTKGWYGCDAPDGWQWIIEDADRLLARLDPEYEIHQVKEKFGTLRYYYGTVADKETQEVMDAIISRAEVLSSKTCEVCGNSSAVSYPSRGIKFDFSAALKATKTHSWYKTICDSCDTEGRYTSVETLNDRAQYEDLEFYAEKARKEATAVDDILKIFLAIAKKDMLEE
jgi:hypothetical protein